jgi:hypothetical protein
MEFECFFDEQVGCLDDKGDTLNVFKLSLVDKKF